MTIAGIATLKSREASFRQTIESIYPQVDRIYAVLNNYDRIPAWIKNKPKIIAVLGNNNLGDAGKFLFVEICDNCYYFSIDDDLFVREGLITTMIEKCIEYKEIITLHGKRYDGIRPIASYRRSFTTNIRCLGNLDEDTAVHVGGSGIMCFNTNDFKLSISNFEHKNMADVIVAREAHRQGVQTIAIKHTSHDLSYLPPPRGTTIWDNTIDDEIQTQILNSFLE